MSMIPGATPVLKHLILEFRRLYGSAAPLNAFDWESLFKNLLSLEYEHCEAEINTVLRATVEDSVFQKYPPKSTFQRGFLKKFISEAEKYGVLHDRLYELIVKSLSSDEQPNQDLDAHYKHIFVKESRFIVKENVSIISGGTTGLCTWQAGIALAHWIANRPKIITGKHVLELGSGVGFTGLFLIFSENPPASFVFSDVHPAVLNALKVNLSINSEQPLESLHRIRETKVRLEHLDWLQISDAKSILKEKPEVILAADVVYCLELIPVLCDALKWLLDFYENCIAVVACTVRNPETLNCFIERMKLVGLKITEECDASVENCELYYPDFSLVKIFIVSSIQS